MNIVFFLIPLSLILASIFVIGFVYSVKSGQYDDMDTPAYRVLLDDEKEPLTGTESTPKVD
ncbi:cbb3-type cytochrome oxidase assembly protein CcoS [bacterium]|jgi:cbb3-type cytochrome oxidase maturation protein|nr:cbb3-type cytochrome oxidase assembly protein CcoS [bacterium]